MTTITENGVTVSDETRTILRECAEREIASAADALAHFETQEESREQLVTRMETAISAYREMVDGTADLATLGFLAELEVSWDCSDTDGTLLPSTVEEHQELLARLDQHLELIKLRDMAAAA